MSNYNINPNNFNNNRNTDINNMQGASVANTRSLFASVFTWMFVALGITTLVTLLFANIPMFRDILFNHDEFGNKTGMSVIMWICLFAPLGLVLLINFAFNRLSFAALLGLFFLYSAVNGVMFSAVIMGFTTASVVTVFACTCALYAVMAVAGYTTKADLTKLGSILMIGLIGIVIASLINIFLHSDSMTFIISIISVVVFTGLTAYDVQKIKELSQQSDGSTTFQKLGVRGALTLYLDFINLFLALLRIFGRRD